MLPELATAGKVWAAFNGAKDAAEAAKLVHDFYHGQQSEGVIEFLQHIASIVGDHRQIFSSPFLQTADEKASLMIHRFTEAAGGRQAPAHTVIPEHAGYDLFSWEFCRAISLPETKDPFDPLFK